MSCETSKEYTYVDSLLNFFLQNGGTSYATRPFSLEKTVTEETEQRPAEDGVTDYQTIKLEGSVNDSSSSVAPSIIKEDSNDQGTPWLGFSQPFVGVALLNSMEDQKVIRLLSA